MTLLLRGVGVPVVRIVPTADVAIDVGTGTVVVDGREVEPTVLWVRHYSPRLFPSDTPGMFAGDAWTVLVDQLSVLAGTALPGAEPGPLRQLRDAASLGVEVPKTLVTTRAVSVPWERCVVKVLGRHYAEVEPGRFSWRLPRIMRAEELADHLPGAPVMVQEYVRHEEELRVYWVGGQVHVLRVVKESPADLWTDAATVTVCPVPVSEAVADTTARLARRWGLVYGAFDFLIRDERLVFLEVNPDGDWRWFENRAGTTDITRAAAALLRRLQLETSPQLSVACLPYLLASGGENTPQSLCGRDEPPPTD